MAHLHQDEATYPDQLSDHLGDQAPAKVTMWGVQEIWLQPGGPVLAMFCSEKAPASIILRVHDLAQEWRRGPATIIGGFHSAVERECLEVLLRGPQPVILCLARGLERMRLKPEYEEPLAAGRLLLLSPFAGKVRRITAETALLRNRFVAALADAVLIAHAQPDSKSEHLAREVIEWGKPLYALENPANAHLLALGAELYSSFGRRD
jgi:predicted Rossmann fold nucleotide-binding protein DprA/Smf involved in DNA uptake